MSKIEFLKKYIDEVISEVEKELDESTATGDIAGYETPNAFSDNSDATKRRKKKIATQLGMQLVGKVESVNEEKVYIDFLNKKKGFKQDRIKFNSYEAAVKWAKQNFDKFDRDMIKYESVNEATASEVIKDLDKVRTDLIKKVDVLISKKKKLYSDVDITTPMSADEKKLDKDIQDIFSQIQQLIQQKRKIKNESINELTHNEKSIRDGNPNNVYYAFYKGQFEAIYSSMGPSGLFDMYWDKFKVRRPAGSKFKLNPEFVFISKKDYDSSTSNRYSKLKPHVDKFWDKLQNESVNEASTSFVSGNSGRTITHLDNKKYQLTKDVKGAQIGNYHSVVLPKGSIIHNLPGGVFVSHPSLKDKFSGIKETPKFGFRVTTNPNTLTTIEKSSKILESVNEYNLNDIIKQIKTYDKPKDAKLLTIKVINKLKDTRNKANLSNKIQIQKIIDTIEGEYNKGKYIKLESVNESVNAKDGKISSNGKLIGYYSFDRDSDSFWVDDVKKGKGQLSFDTKKEVEDYFKKNERDALKHLEKVRESVNENRWLELKNDDSMHANKKLAVGLRELKNQLQEVETFFRWYNQIKTMNELDSNQYWKRTNSHIYKIKERIINIARTLKEIEQ